jgi:gentisate 1,2-dioxygenase
MTTASDSLETLFEQAVADHAKPLWPVIGELSPPRPCAKAVPHVWRYDRLRPLCERAAQLVGTPAAERRVFMLCNPGLEEPFATDTLYAGLQTILPGEVARAHRHTPFALRFIIEGEGAYTAVEGEKVVMGRGDLVLTPAWEWHDHGNDSDRPMVWLDGLDLPLWRAIPAIFTEHYPKARYPSTRQDGPSIRRYPWAEVAAELQSIEGRTAEVRYAHREHAGEISATIGAAAVRLERGARTEPRRETASAVYHVYEGAGRSLIGGTEITWQQGDTFAVPAWHTAIHHNTTIGRTYLFRFDDRPLLTAIGAYRADRGRENGVHDVPSIRG